MSFAFSFYLFFCLSIFISSHTHLFDSDRDNEYKERDKQKEDQKWSHERAEIAEEEEEEAREETVISDSECFSPLSVSPIDEETGGEKDRERKLRLWTAVTKLLTNELYVSLLLGTFIWICCIVFGESFIIIHSMRFILILLFFFSFYFNYLIVLTFFYSFILFHIFFSLIFLSFVSLSLLSFFSCMSGCIHSDDWFVLHRHRYSILGHVILLSVFSSSLSLCLSSDLLSHCRNLSHPRRLSRWVGH